MADDDRRVEPRTALIGRGAATTPERIDELAQRAKELEKLTRPAPQRAFAELLTGSSKPAAPPTKPNKRTKGKELPRRGPRPGLVHPSQREVFGRDEDDETVVLKG